MYNDIAEFVGTKKSIVTSNRELTANFVNDEASYVLIQNAGGEFLEAAVDVAVRLRDSANSAIQRAISFFYRQSGIKRPA